MTQFRTCNRFTHFAKSYVGDSLYQFGGSSRLWGNLCFRASWRQPLAASARDLDWSDLLHAVVVCSSRKQVLAIRFINSMARFYFKVFCSLPWGSKHFEKIQRLPPPSHQPRQGFVRRPFYILNLYIWVYSVYCILTIGNCMSKKYSDDRNCMSKKNYDSRS